MKSTEEKKLRTEKHAMRLSFAGSAAFVVAEFVSFFYDRLPYNPDGLSV